MKQNFRMSEWMTGDTDKKIRSVATTLQPVKALTCRLQTAPAAASGPSEQLRNLCRGPNRNLFKSVDFAALLAGPDQPRPMQSVLPISRPSSPEPSTVVTAQTTTVVQPLLRRPIAAPSTLQTVPGKKTLALYQSQQRVLNEFQNDIHIILEQIRSSQRSLQIIGFTSTQSGEGVSTICSSLAAMSAEMEKPITWEKWKTNANSGTPLQQPHAVLVIDAQLHNPSIHTLFAAAPSPGLAAVLAGAPMSQSVQKVLPHLHIVPAGDVTKKFLTQSEWLTLAAFIKEAQRVYSHIFLDLPALAQYPSAIDLARLCQAVTLVVQANRTQRHSVRYARSLLEKNKISILGGILNRRERSIPEWLDRRL